MPFVKGQSGNPGGRPKNGLTPLLRQRLGRKGPDGRRNDIAIADALIAQASAGDLDAIKYVFDRVDGKIPDAAGQSLLGVAFTLRIDRGDDAHDSLHEAEALPAAAIRAVQ